MNIETRSSVASLLASLDRLAPLITERRSAFDRDRRLPDDVFSALAKAGLFRLWLPRSLGGPQLDPLDFLTVVETAAALDGSVGWLVGNGGGMSRIGGYLAPEFAREIFADPLAFVTSSTGATGTMVPAPGGWRVTGRWPFGSGSAHATHFMGFAAEGGVPGPDSPQFCFYVPRADVVVPDTWHVSGMRGTSSSDFALRDVFVPADHVHPFFDHTPSDPALLYRMPPISTFAWTVATVPLGIARGALRAFHEMAVGKTRMGTTTIMAEREAIQAMVGRCEADWKAARAFLTTAMSELMAATDHGGGSLVEARADLRLAAAHAAQTAVAIVDRLQAAAGAVSIFESCPLERIGRDVRAAAHHVAMGPANFTNSGRLALGLDMASVRF